MTDYLPPFQIDYSYLVGSTAGTIPVMREVSHDTIHMCLAALDAMRFNRYWRAGDDWLTDAQKQDRTDRIDRAIFELLEAVDTIPPDAADCPLPPLPMAGGYDDCAEDETMPIIYINGQAYLTDNCGCGTKFFQLTESAVSLDDSGNPQILAPQNAEPGYDFPELEDSFLTCYAGKAVPYLLARAEEFVQTYLSILEQGLDSVAGGLDELLDIASIVGDILGLDRSGFVDLIRGFDEAELDDAWEDTTFIQTMKDNWTFTGPVSKNDLMQWVKAGPAYVGNVPLKVFMMEWLKFSLVLGYNKQLSIYAMECETGNTLEDLQDEYGYDYSEAEENSRTFAIYDWQPEETILNGVDEWRAINSGFIPAGAEILAIAIEFTLAGNPDIGIWTTGASSHNYYGPDGTHELSANHDADAENVIEAYWGSGLSSGGTLTAKEFAGLSIYVPAGYTSFTVHRCAAVIELT